MTKNACNAVSTPAHLECQICFDSFRNPTQLVSCGHIFCQQCISGTSTRCYLCRQDVEGTQRPSEDIVAQAEAVPVMCSSCGWRGSRKASETHRCDHRQTHSTYMSYPQHTDSQWVEIATQGGNVGESPSASAVQPTYSGIPL